MIFTIGRTKGYQKLFKEQAAKGEVPGKKGRTKDNPGGTVWNTRDAAQAFLDNNRTICINSGDGAKAIPSVEFSVYGVEADWDKHTVDEGDGFDWRYLTIDSDLVELQREGEVTPNDFRRCVCGHFRHQHQDSGKFAGCNAGKLGSAPWECGCSCFVATPDPYLDVSDVHVDDGTCRGPGRCESPRIEFNGEWTEDVGTWTDGHVCCSMYKGEILRVRVSDMEHAAWKKGAQVNTDG